MALTSKKSGYGASVKLDGGAVAVMQDINFEASQEFVETNGLSADMVERVPGPSDWSFSGSRRYASMAFLSAATVAMSANTSVGLAIINAASTTVVSTVGFIRRAGLHLPMGAVTEDLEIISKGTRPVVTAD